MFIVLHSTCCVVLVVPNTNHSRHIYTWSIHSEKMSRRDLLCWHLSASRWFTSCYAEKSDPDNSDPEARWWWVSVGLEVKVERGQSLWQWNANVTGKLRSDDSECTLTAGNLHARRFHNRLIYRAGLSRLSPLTNFLICKCLPVIVLTVCAINCI